MQEHLKFNMTDEDEEDLKEKKGGGSSSVMEGENASADDPGTDFNSSVGTVMGSAASSMSYFEDEGNGSIIKKAEEAKYSDLVPKDPLDYRLNLENLLTKSGKGKIGNSIRPFVESVKELNAVRAKNFTDGGDILNVMDEASAVAGRTTQTGKEYLAGRHPWTKAGKKRLQIVEEAVKFIDAEQRNSAKLWGLYGTYAVEGAIPEEIFYNVSPDSMYDAVAMGPFAIALQKEDINTAKSKLSYGGPLGSEKDSAIARREHAGEVVTGIASHIEDIDRRKDKTIATTQMIFRGDSPERVAQTLRNLAVNNNVEGLKSTRRARVLEIERAFETLLTFDIGKMQFNSIEDLTSGTAAEAYSMGLFAFDLQDRVKEYKGWISDPKVDTCLTEEMFDEVRAKWSCCQEYQAWGDFASYVTDPDVEGLIDLDSLFRIDDPGAAYEEGNRKDKEVAEQPANIRKKLSSIYSSYARLVLRKDIGLGKDPYTALENDRKGYKLGADLTTEALEAIRKHRSKK